MTDNLVPQDVSHAGISLLLPPWWGIVLAGASMRQDVGLAASRLVPEAPGTDLRTLRARAATQILGSLQGMVQYGLLAWLYEAEPLADVRTGASLVVLPMPSVEGVRPIDAVLALAIQEDDVHVAEEKGRVVVRFSSSETIGQELQDMFLAQLEEAGQDQDDKERMLSVLAAAKGVQALYFAGDPESDQDWLCVLGMVAVPDTEIGVELREAVIELFDQIVRSVRIGQEAAAPG